MARNNSRMNCCQKTSTVSATSGGYEAEFDLPLDKKYLCPVCLSALRSPRQTKCGHRFCRLCMQRIIGTCSHTKCPVDKTWLSVKSDIFEDVAFEREILSMSVLCNNIINGCSWKGDLRNLQGHCDVCPCAKILCPNGCEEQYLRNKSDEHLRDCCLRVFDCNYCGETIVKKDQTRHQMVVCPKFPIVCCNCGQAGILREEMSKHNDTVNGDCPNTLVSCAFRELGCIAEIKRCDLPSHNDEVVSRHMQLLLAQVAAQKTLVNLQTDALEDSKKTCSQLELRLDRMTRTLSNTDEIVVKQAERISLLENTSYNGCLHWKINLASHLEEGDSVPCILSPPFYTSRPGYKLSACLEVDGHVTRCATYTSLFIVLQPGDYDDHLHFPFSAKCSVRLFDQCEGAGHDFTTSITCTNMQRSRVGDVQEQFRGRLKFMQTDLLMKRRFLNNGVLYMKIDVDLMHPFEV